MAARAPSVDKTRPARAAAVLIASARPPLPRDRAAIQVLVCLAGVVANVFQDAALWASAV